VARTDSLGYLVSGGSTRGVRGVLHLRTPALITLLATVLLAIVGIDAIDLAMRASTDSGEGRPLVLRKQMLFMTVGACLMGLVAIVHYRMLAHWALVGFALCIGLLVFLMAPGVPESIVSSQRGTRSWINLGPVDLQPGEFTKVAFVIMIAAYLRYRTKQRTFRGIMLVGLISMVPICLITLQPDLGTAVLFIPSLFAMLIASGARLRHLTIIVILAAMAAPATYPFLKPHQKVRIVGMIRQIEGDRTTSHDINFQSFTAQTLVGAGGFQGQAEAHSRVQVHYNRLPEAHNDMIYSVIVNRYGMLGGLWVMALYVLWFVGAIWTAALCRTPFGRLIAVGVAGFIASQAVLGIGMNLGILPIVGVNLPFVSYGGSSMLTCCIMTGLILSVGLHRSDTPGRPAFEFNDDD